MPYMKKLAVAHQLHHSEKYGGAPWGMFLAPQVRPAQVGFPPEIAHDNRSLDPCVSSNITVSHSIVQELDDIPGASEELDRLVAELDWSKR